jgi:murein DD-endopeptidase MepM/ murein hydrolase activator NlpD
VKRRRLPLRPPGQTLPALFVAFVVGGATGWWIHASMSSQASTTAALVSPSSAPASALPTTPIVRPLEVPRPTTGSVESGPDRDAIIELRRHALRLPVDDVDVAAMAGSFAESRSGGEPHGHEAVDLLAPRNTPVRAVEDGKIAKLFVSKAGGNTIYQFDPSEQFCYYYAHLDHYASGLHDGQLVAKGEVIGYVGTSGNAPPNTPHLHFAIFSLDDDKRWWHGAAIDPYLVYRP